MNAPMSDPMAPRTTVTRTPRSCLPGSTSRASGPTIAPATRAARMVPITVAPPPSNPLGGGDGPAVPALPPPCTRPAATSHTGARRDMTKAADPFRSAALVMCLDLTSSPRGDGSDLLQHNCSRMRSVRAEPDARLALGTRRHVTDRRRRDDDPSALVVGQLEDV